MPLPFLKSLILLQEKRPAKVGNLIPVRNGTSRFRIKGPITQHLLSIYYVAGTVSSYKGKTHALKELAV